MQPTAQAVGKRNIKVKQPRMGRKKFTGEECTGPSVAQRPRSIRMTIKISARPE
jgi:hypothetical protein